MSEVRSLKNDLMMLTKARLSLLVVVTTFFGFWLKSVGGRVDGWLMFHTILGTTLAALGSSVFNQLIEIDVDSKMERTKSRPLPARRIPAGVAFVVGWLLCGAALVHLGNMVNLEAAGLTALTLIVYIFVYTPMKQRSSMNTLVGAVAGAIPPVIGWVAAAGQPGEGEFFRWGLVIEPGALFLFGLLFFWQLPHFVAINWMYRDEYLRGGFVMWSNADETGKRTATLATIFSLCLASVMLIPIVYGNAGLWFGIGAGLLSVVMVLLALKFYRDRTRATARRLFLYTLIYLPLLLGVALVTWKNPN
ncbi:MAG: heme o synthase [Verrucomicrobiales bacterium]|nr:heme o synthase [Verrucomicrobiales bacterium]